MPVMMLVARVFVMAMLLFLIDVNEIKNLSEIICRSNISFARGTLMNIDVINNQSVNRTMDVDKNQYGTHSFGDSRMKTQGLGYSLDITGKVRENAAYGKEELKSAQEIAQAAGMQDVQLNRDYMAVMSNSMSSEDFAKLTEDGVNPTQTSVEESVTNLDKIKIKMAEAGVTITGFNDDLTSEDYDKVTGSESIAKAAQTAKNLEQMSEETVAYLLQNNLEPTINNIYKAEHSTVAPMSIDGISQSGLTYSGVATYAGKAETDVAWEDLEGQAEAIVKNAGMDDEAGLEAAKWIVENQIPLTQENLTRYVELTQKGLPTDDAEIFKSIENAIIEGKDPMDANLMDRENIYEKAVRIVNDFTNMTVEDVSLRRQLEEVRLAMTSEANLMLLRKGISIDTKDLANLVDELKEAERQFYEPLLGDKELADEDVNNSNRHSGLNLEDESITYKDKTANNDLLDSRISIYKSAVSLIREIPQMPVEAVANVSQTEEADDFSKAFTINELASAGNILKQTYERAGQSYEALMTAPRADMGDSIKKAFGNVDDILADLDLDLNDANRKAVRTLGYANMDINRQSVDNIRETTMTVNRVISLMTPSRILNMIREGHNPLEDNIYDLEKVLSKESPEESAKKYSQFLVDLEHKGEITEDEKSAYIGMYRLFKLIEKQDGRVIGNVLSTGQELTMQNMLSASRSNRHKNMDVKIDDNFGLLEDLVEKDISITEQISKGFTQMLLAPLSKDYIEEELNDIRRAAKVAPEVTDILENISETVSVENILAASEMITSFDKSTKKLFDKSEKDDELENMPSEAIEKNLDDEDVAHLINDFNDEVSAKSAYEEYVMKASDIALRHMEDEKTSIDVKEWSMIHKQLGFAGSLGKSDSYEIPVKTKDGYTSIHLTIKHGDNSGKVVASMETEEYGKLTARFTIGADGVDGFVVSDSRQGIDNIKSKKADIISEMSKEGINAKDINFVFGKIAKSEDYIPNNDEAIRVTNNQLYKVAKAFVIAVGE